jgi:uncharacterized alpha-E superfamily protein
MSGRVLTRTAESLFWVGRYVERADDTARILDVHVHHVVAAAANEDAACRVLLDVMGVAQPVTDVDVRRLVHSLAVDPDVPSSIAASFAAARENGRNSRGTVSAEMWECLNATWHAFKIEAVGAAAAPHRLFRFVKERAALFAGLADATMSRDDAWRFLVLGRSLERVDMTARLLASRLGGKAEPHDWVTLLSSCSAHEAYLRARHRAPAAREALEFLLLDRSFPRSIFHALLTADACLSELDPPMFRDGRIDEARRILGLARTSLEYESVDIVLTDLGPRLVALQEACAAAGRALAQRFFQQAVTLPWHQEAVLA